jgi:Leucine-rich repeat (LRR) protein
VNCVLKNFEFDRLILVLLTGLVAVHSICASEEVACTIAQSEILECNFSNETAISTAETKISNPKNDKVEWLAASHNKDMKFVPVDIVEKFPNLIYIMFYKNSIESLTKRSFHGLNNLKRLYFSEEPITNIDEDAFDDIEDLRTLKLLGTKLSSLSFKILSKLSSLEELNLRGNKFTSFETDMFKNNHDIQELDLSENNVGTLPSNIFQTMSQSLKIVLMHSMGLSTLDSNWFKNCHKITLVTLHKNKVTEIPHDFFADLKSLQDITMPEITSKTFDFKVFENSKNLRSINFFHKFSNCSNIDVIDTLPEFMKVNILNDSNNILESAVVDGNNTQPAKQKIMEFCKEN